LPPTEQEMLEFYESVKDEQPPRPPTVSFRQIVVRSSPAPPERQRAFRLADSLRVLLVDHDADFNELARRYSDDPGSRDQGGEMGWVRRGQGLVPQFEEVAFNIRPGHVVGPVETAFGFHLIEVVRAQPAEVQVRHILIAPEITEEDVARAERQAAEVAEQIRRGVPFDSLARLYHEPMMDRVADGMPLEGLQPEYQTALAGARPGDVIGPVKIQLSGNLFGWVVIDFMGSREAGQFTFEDLRDQIRRALSEQNALGRYLEELREKTFIEIRL
jgi:peptidyl-prolyl cis-trans isomerase SurA